MQCFGWSCQWPRYIHIGLCSRPEQRGPFCVFHRTIPYNPQRLYKTAEPNPVNRLGHSRHNPPTPSSQLVNKHSDVQSPAVYREPTFLQTFTKQMVDQGMAPTQICYCEHNTVIRTRTDYSPHPVHHRNSPNKTINFPFIFLLIEHLFALNFDNNIMLIVKDIISVK